MAGRKKQEHLTFIELQLMLICWEMGEVPASYIWEEFNKTERRSYSAIKTELDRITVKGYLVRRKLGPIWLYAPKYPKSEVLPSVFSRFMAFVQKYDILPLFVRYADKKGLTGEEKTEIRKLLDEAED